MPICHEKGREGGRKGHHRHSGYGVYKYPPGPQASLSQTSSTSRHNSTLTTTKESLSTTDLHTFTLRSRYSPAPGPRLYNTLHAPTLLPDTRLQHFKSSCLSIQYPCALHWQLQTVSNGILRPLSRPVFLLTVPFSLFDSPIATIQKNACLYREVPSSRYNYPYIFGLQLQWPSSTSHSPMPWPTTKGAIATYSCQVGLDVHDVSTAVSR